MGDVIILARPKTVLALIRTLLLVQKLLSFMLRSSSARWLICIIPAQVAVNAYMDHLAPVRGRLRSIAAVPSPFSMVSLAYHGYNW